MRLIADKISALRARAEAASKDGRTPLAVGFATKALGFERSAELLAFRARLQLQQRKYARALGDYDAAVALAPSETGYRLRRAEVLVAMNRPAEAAADLRHAVRLNPADGTLRLARLRLSAGPAALKEARSLTRDRDPNVALEAEFLSGCLELKLGRHAAAASSFGRLVSSLPERAGLSMRARFYQVVAETTAPAFRKRFSMTTPAKVAPTLYLCGLGIFPPYTATLEVLHAIGRCGAVFNNIPGPEVRDLLSTFCAVVRPADYTAQRDERTWVRRIFAELAKGRDVGFVTRGHPLVLGRLALALTAEARKRGIPVETFGAVSSIDFILARSGTALGDDIRGVQAFDWLAVKEAAALNTRQPLIVFFPAGLGNRTQVASLRETLGRFYPAGQTCLVYGPKYDNAPRELTVGKLPETYSRIDPSLMLYLPARISTPRRGSRGAPLR